MHPILGVFFDKIWNRKEKSVLLCVCSRHGYHLAGNKLLL